MNRTYARNDEKKRQRAPGAPQQRTCGHCFSAATPVDCSKCGCEMCEDCVSHHPDAGPVCGLCYDHIVEEPE